MSFNGIGNVLGMRPSAFSIENEINAGWSGSISFSQRPGSLNFGDLTVIPINLSQRFGTTAVNLGDIPPMIARARKKTFSITGGWNGGLDLIDLHTYKLSSGTNSFPTFYDVQSSEIVSAISAACGVPIANHSSFHVWKEDFKQVDGWGPLQRCGIIAGQQLVITQNGARYVEADDTVADGWTFIADEQTVSYNPLDRYNKLFVSKNLGMGTAQPTQYYNYNEPGYLLNQPLATPLSTAFAYDMSSQGSVAWVGFWDSGDRLIAIYPMGGNEADGYTIPINGEWPAVKFSLWVYPSPTTLLTNARIRIVGIPPIVLPSDIDAAIAKTFGTGNRGYPQPFTDTMIPSEDFCNDKHVNWLREINRGTHTITAKGPFQCAKRLLSSHFFDDVNGRIEKIRYEGQGNSCSTSIVVECE